MSNARWLETVVPCYHPLTAFRLGNGTISFAERGEVLATLELPCGQCIGCRLERSRQWAVRCVHEAQLWERNIFITLTYSDEHIPEGGSLCYRDFQLFLKRLRRTITTGKPVRFFVCGEYGETNYRPHFHALLFNFDFTDKVKLAVTGSGAQTYRSPLLEKLWPFGFSSIGDVTFESAAYCARYIMKKVTGSAADDHYRCVNAETGEITNRVPEFCHMSLKPGIAKLWIGKYLLDVYPRGRVVSNGVPAKAPRYYDSLYRQIDEDAYARLQFDRELQARARIEDNTRERLAVKEQVTKARVSLLKRSI